MKKQIITILVISILLALSYFIPSVICFSFKSGSQILGDIIIVDDEGDGDYFRIQDALNHANPGDTIEVYSGTYYEHGIVISDDNITLKGMPYELGNGSDTGKPFINGEGKDDLIDIKAKNVVIDGLCMENDGGSLANGIIALFHESDACTISNNDIAHTTMSCIWSFGSNNKILNNNISHSVIRQGIVLCDPCSNCIVSGNVISDVATGILCWGSNSNTITGNKIDRCSDFGIDLAGGNYNTIESNTIEDNRVGVQIYLSVGSRINNNNFIGNQWQARFQYGFPLILCLTNRWNGNYWGRSRLLPYPIMGIHFFFPWIQFDWNPAKEPYDI